MDPVDEWNGIQFTIDNETGEFFVLIFGVGYEIGDGFYS